MTDMAEFYGVQCLKELCDEFLAKKEKTVETIDELFDFARKYSLPKFRNSVRSFFWNHYEIMCKSDAFISFEKPFVAYLLAVDISLYKKEILFEGIYKWAEHRVLKDQAVEGDENFKFHKAVEAELSTFLPKFKISQMDFDFLKDFVAEKGFLLSAAKLSHLFLIHNSKNRWGATFKKTYELAEKQAMKKQEMCPKKNFILRDAVNAYLVDVMPNVKFSSMSLSSLHFAVEKGYFVSSAEITKAFLSCKDRKIYSRELSFKEAVELAEILALKKQEMFPEENFNLDDSVKAYLVDVLPNVEFSKMNFNFLKDFVGTSFVLPCL
uniref:Uncharacterized protein n=1 Tax=Panagrolaimus superbus TaxID=310955 RepID=A0A914YQ63_9BILA